MFSSSSVEAFFPTPVWVHDLESERAEKLNAFLLERIQSLVSPLPELPAGEGWQTDYRLHHLEEFNELVQIFGFACKQVLNFLAVEFDTFEITGCWANLGPPGAAHRGHHHSNNYLSGVYYVQAPPGGDTITFSDPRFQIEQIVPRYREPNAHNSTAHHLNVVAGRLVIFPAWLVHSVPPNTSDQLRMSVAFNVMISDFTEKLSPPRWEGLPLKP